MSSTRRILSNESYDDQRFINTKSPLVGTLKRDDAYYARKKADNEKRRVAQALKSLERKSTVRAWHCRFTQAEVESFRAVWREYGGIYDRSARRSVCGMSLNQFGRVLGISESTVKSLVTGADQFRRK